MSQPLAVIGAAADNLSLSDGENAEEVRRRATRIRQTVKRMSMLIDNVLAGERLDAERAALRAEPLDLGVGGHVRDERGVLGVVGIGLRHGGQAR